ncbi:hypothetical protein LLG95_10520 [bacterium]|nr:hypothetical protein [bacterium]
MRPADKKEAAPDAGRSFKLMPPTHPYEYRSPKSDLNHGVGDTDFLFADYVADIQLPTEPRQQ